MIFANMACGSILPPTVKGIREFWHFTVVYKIKPWQHYYEDEEWSEINLRFFSKLNKVHSQVGSDGKLRLGQKKEVCISSGKFLATNSL